MGADAEGVVAGPQQVSAQGNPPPLGLSAGQQSARRQQPPQQPAIGAGLLSSDGFFNVSSQDFATATNSILSSHAPHDQAFLSQYTAAGSGFQ